MSLWQDSLFGNDTAWVPPVDYPRLSGVVALDLETYDPLIKSHGPGWCFPSKPGKICGVALAGENWANYWSVGHREGNLPANHVYSWLKRELNNPDLTLLMYNASYDLGWLSTQGIYPKAKVIDVGIGVPLLDENRLSYSLDDVCHDWMGSNKDYSVLLQAAKKGLSLGKTASKTAIMGMMHELPAWAVANYAIADVTLTRDLWFKEVQPRIEQEELQGIFQLEHDLIPVLMDMRRKGVRINVKAAELLSQDYSRKKNLLLKEIQKLTGRTLNLWEAGDVDKAFQAVGITWSEVTAQGEKSFRSDAMERFDHPLAKLIVQARRLDKADGTFIKGSILGHLIGDRLHAVFSALRSDEGGAVTGRFSSSNPNLQNFPSREETIARDIRGLFLPDEDSQAWASIDFSSQEPRMAVHFAQAAGVPGVRPFVEAYRVNPNLDFHQKGADITGLKRKQAKNLTLGKMYGMGGAKMCHSLDLPTEWLEVKDKRDPTRINRIEVAGPEGQAVMDQYDKYMPFVKGLSELCVRKAEKRGWIRTLLGRRRHFQTQDGERKKGDRGAFTYKALNCLIQGSSADMTKKAMVDLYRSGARLLVTVHDEVGIACDNPKQALEYQRIMCESVQLHVPVTSDLEVGPNWGNLVDMKKLDGTAWPTSW